MEQSETHYPTPQIQSTKATRWACAVVVAILFIDQLSKILVKTNMMLEERIPIISERVYIYFVENPGFAFGMSFGGAAGKIILTLFRVVASTLIILYIRSIIKKGASLGVVIGLSAVLAGALGNIIDSMFYGLLFSESTYSTVAQFLPEGGGYASFLQGRVVDMIYCPIIRGTFPEWLPLRGGEPFTFFSPIFNVADAAITLGVVYLLLFQRKFFKVEEKEG
ncbi:MAG: lipoprotein signal peptidase [Bacteroidales bacterium]|jgi:signal peptidase II|nr:lipoprotein signal peptidase [Bacteroidales bacterium]